MSTKNQTVSTNAYNTNANSTYNAFQPQIMGQLSSMAQNPFGQYFQNQLKQQQQVSNQVGQRNQSNMLQNLRTGGGILSNSGGFVSSALSRNNIGNSLLQGNAFNSAYNTALNNRNSALMGMEAYQPLQTGSTSTNTTSGLGTWLPQVAGMAMSMLAPGLGSMMGGGSFSSGYGGGASGGGGGGGASMARPSSGSMWATPPTVNPYGPGQPQYT